MCNSKWIEMISELIEICSVPTLRMDIENIPFSDVISNEEFRNVLEVNTPLLLDILSTRFDELIDDEDNDTGDLQIQLMMLTCEHISHRSSIPPPYLLNEQFGENLLRITSPLWRSRRLLEQCLEKYKQKLLNGKWKRVPGTCFGFVSFSDLFLKFCSADSKVDDLSTILFILSVASQFIECIHDEIKLLGLQLYKLILSGNGELRQKQVVESNVHKVIIKNCLDNSQKQLSEDSSGLLWTVVQEAISVDSVILKELNWNELDDSLHLLFQKIKMESKRSVRRKLCVVLLGIIKACYVAAGNLDPSHDKLNSISDHRKEFGERKVENVKLFRWIPDLKEIFIFECLSISNDGKDTSEALTFISMAYYFTMFGLTADQIKPILEELAERLTPLLLEIYRIYRETDEDVIQKILLILKHLLAHLDQINPIPESQSNYHCALNQLLNHHLHLASTLTQNGGT